VIGGSRAFLRRSTSAGASPASSPAPARFHSALSVREQSAGRRITLPGAQVINICLNAVEVSRPFFITFLGERYGWCHATDPDGQLFQQTLDNGMKNFPWIKDYQDRSVTELEIMEAFLYKTEQGPRPVAATAASAESASRAAAEEGDGQESFAGEGVSG
jgi:hypothetical protein